MPGLVIREALSDADWSAVQSVRQRVFVEGQACPPEEEWDVYDAPARRGVDVHHLMGTVDSETVAVARWRSVDVGGKRVAKLERFAVMPEGRGRGWGRAMVDAALGAARDGGNRRFVLHAQAYLRAFYESFGFEAEGEPFDEAGIEHVKMTLTDA